MKIILTLFLLASASLAQQTFDIPLLEREPGACAVNQVYRNAGTNHIRICGPANSWTDLWPSSSASGDMVAATYETSGAGVPSNPCATAGATYRNTSTTPYSFYSCPSAAGNWVGPVIFYGSAVVPPATSGVLKVIAGVPTIVTGPDTDCVKRDGSTGACLPAGVASDGANGLTVTGNVAIGAPSPASTPPAGSLNFAGSLYQNGVLFSGGGAGVTYCAPSSASGTAYTCTPSPAVTAYAAGLTLAFVPDVAGSGGATTVAVSGLAAKSIKISDGSTDPGAGRLSTSELHYMTYDGTVFRLMKRVTTATFLLCAGPCTVAETSNWKWTARSTTAFSGCTIDAGTYPTGAGGTTVDVYKNGVTNSIFTAAPALAGGASAYAESTSMSSYAAMVKGDYLTAKVTAVAGTITGQNFNLVCTATY